MPSFDPFLPHPEPMIRDDHVVGWDWTGPPHPDRNDLTDGGSDAFVFASGWDDDALMDPGGDEDRLILTDGPFPTGDAAMAVDTLIFDWDDQNTI